MRRKRVTCHIKNSQDQTHYIAESPNLLSWWCSKGKVVFWRVLCFNSLSSFRHLYPWGWCECSRKVSWHWCAHWRWCCHNRGCTSCLVCWLSQGYLPHRADLWPQLMMPLLYLFHPPWETQPYRDADPLAGCSCQVMKGMDSWWLFPRLALGSEMQKAWVLRDEKTKQPFLCAIFFWFVLMLNCCMMCEWIHPSAVWIHVFWGSWGRLNFVSATRCIGTTAETRAPFFPP